MVFVGRDSLLVQSVELRGSLKLKRKRRAQCSLQIEL